VPTISTDPDPVVDVEVEFSLESPSEELVGCVSPRDNSVTFEFTEGRSSCNETSGILEICAILEAAGNAKSGCGKAPRVNSGIPLAESRAFKTSVNVPGLTIFMLLA
jgi:hypothetical protein